jgi:hypothetical protein
MTLKFLPLLGVPYTYDISRLRVNSLLHVSALQRRHLQGIQYQPIELLPNVVKTKWDEGCIL